MARRRLVPIASVIGLLSITVLVWYIQVANKQRALLRHTSDVSTQAARRLETFVATQLAVAGTLAEHWSRQGDNEPRSSEFRDLAELILADFASYHALVLVGSDGRPLDAVAYSDSAYESFLSDEGWPILQSAPARDRPVVSDPFQTSSGGMSFFAAWPLEQGSPDEPSHLLAEYRVEELIADCFHGQMRTEFSYAVEDQGEPLYQFVHSGGRLRPPRRTIGSVQTVAVANRTWRLSVMPRPDMLRLAGWTADLSVPVFGLVLSAVMGLLVHLLMLRMDRLRVSEAGYRGVFDCATEGLLVLATDGRATILDANPSTGRIFGWPTPELIGESFEDLLPETLESRLGQLTESPGSQASLRLEATARTRAGDSLDVEVNASRFTHRGEPAILVSVTDVSERRAAARRQVLLAQRALAAQEDERARLARDLHDDLGQLLTGLRLELDFVRRQHRRWAAALEPSIDIVAAAIDNVRRLCKGLRPPLLDDLGLESSVRHLVEEFAAHSDCRVESDIKLDEHHRSLSGNVALCTYRVLQEALTNVSRHADATRVGVTLASHDSELVMTVADDGKGFELTRLPVTSALGITGMLERASLVDGRLEISSAPLAGTRVELRIPINVRSKDTVMA